MSTAPHLTLNNGVEIPAVGFGVFQTPPEETRSAVEAALATGYRHIDTAAAYGNERQVGEAVTNSGVDRADVFLETKIWISDYGYDQTLHSFDKSARKLGVDQIDLLILHQALPSEFDKTLEAYGALETLLAGGKVRAIGVSNFMVDHLTALLDKATIVPAVNQIEAHPYFTQQEVQAFGAQHGILTQAWSPIGGITFYRDGEHTSTLQDPVIGEIAKAHDKTPRASDAALAPAAGPLSHPEVDEPAAPSPRTSTSSTSSSPASNSPRSTAWTPATAAAPNPLTSPCCRDCGGGCRGYPRVDQVCGQVVLFAVPADPVEQERLGADGDRVVREPVAHEGSNEGDPRGCDDAFGAGKCALQPLVCQRRHRVGIGCGTVPLGVPGGERLDRGFGIDIAVEVTPRRQRGAPLPQGLGEVVQTAAGPEPVVQHRTRFVPA
jgi:diketogulonate reductase-like aldo/keto reductase